MKRNLKKDLRHIFTIAMVLMPILNIYSTSFLKALCLGEFCGILLIPILLIFRGEIFKVSYSYWGFVIYLFFLSLLLTVFIPQYVFSETVIKLLKFIFYTLNIFFFSSTFFEYEYGKRLYINTSYAASLYLLAQYFAKIILNIQLPVVLPHANLAYILSTSEEYNIALQRTYALQYRPSGFFLEPAAFCQYTIYSLIFLMFIPNKSKKENGMIFVISAAILLTYSAIGYVALVSFLIVWFIWTRKKRNFTTNVSIVLTVGLAFVWLNSRFDFWGSTAQRIATVSSTSVTTGTMRLLRGLIVFLKLPLWAKFTGIGIGNFGAFVEKYDIVTFFDGGIARTSEYMNAFSTILVSAGVIGLVIYVRSMWQIYKMSNKCQRCLVIVLSLVMVSSNVFFSASYMLPMIFIYIGIIRNMQKQILI